MKYAGSGALALAAVALAMSGCGSSAKSSNAALSRTGLIAKADAICARVNAKTKSLGATISNPQDYVHVLPLVASYERAAFGELATLIPPPAMNEDWKLIVSGTQTIASDAGQIAAYAKAENLKKAGPIMAAAIKERESVLAVAQRDGLSACAQLS